MCKCNFMLWPGSGYCLSGPFTVEDELLKKNNLDFAVELLAAQLIANGDTAFYMTSEEYDEFLRSCDYDPEEMEEDLDGWLYVDGTMEGAPYPIYLNIENMKVEFAD